MSYCECILFVIGIKHYLGVYYLGLLLHYYFFIGYASPCSVKSVLATSFSIHLLQCLSFSFLLSTRAHQVNIQHKTSLSETLLIRAGEVYSVIQ